MCPQIFRVVRSFSQSFLALFTSGEHSLGDKLLSLDVFRAMGNLFPTSESRLALPVSWVLSLALCGQAAVRISIGTGCKNNAGPEREPR